MACSESPPQPLLVSLRIFPANPVVQEGKTTPLTATGTFSDSSRQDLTESVRWSSLAPWFVTISDEAGSRGLMTGVAHGTATIRAVHEASGQIAEALAVVPFPPPLLSSVQPSSGPAYGGTVITLQGTDLSSDTAVTLGGVPLLNLTPIDDTSMSATTPPGALGSKDLVVTNSLGSTTLLEGFTYVDPWRPANTGLYSGYVKELVRHPSDPSVLYAGTVREESSSPRTQGRAGLPATKG